MIRRRLSLAITATVALAMAIGAWLTLSTLETQLIDDVDQQFVSGDLSRELRDQLSGQTLPDRQNADAIDLRRDVAFVQYDRSGDVVRYLPSGTTADPDPVPDVDDLEPSDGIRTVDDVDGEERYRALAVRTAGGGRVVVASSLHDVDETLRTARTIQIVLSVGVTATVALGCWLWIRRAFTPIQAMIGTATRIAGGALDERTEVAERDSEVGHLSTALNTMLDRLEGALDESTRSEERMRRFVADASHDLRTPLTSVRGYAELYRQGADDPDAVATAMARIEAESLRMSRLVDDLLLLARLDQTRAPNHVPVDLGRVAGEAVDAARVIDGARTYDLDAAPGLVVDGDPDLFRQVLDNLLANARAHTPESTTVAVSVATRASGDASDAPDGDVVLEVVDDGPGFPDGDTSRAFDRFWRSTRADRNPVAGSGLGLAIVSSIVSDAGGTVELTSSPDAGTRFTLRFPRSHPTSP